jgi:hypothetical protein
MTAGAAINVSERAHKTVDFTLEGVSAARSLSLRTGPKALHRSREPVRGITSQQMVITVARAPTAGSSFGLSQAVFRKDGREFRAKEKNLGGVVEPQ